MQPNMSKIYDTWEHAEPHHRRICEVAATGNHSVFFQGAPNEGKSTWAELILQLQETSESYVFKATKPSELLKTNFINECKTLWITGEHLLLNGTSRMLAERVNRDVQMLCEYIPCDCGYFGHIRKPCWCTVETIQQHQRRAHQSFRDRFELFTTVTLRDEKYNGEDFNTVRERVQFNRRKVQEQRLTNNEYVEVHPEAMQLFDLCVKRFAINLAQQNNFMKIAETIRIMNGDYTSVQMFHMAEAIQYRGGISVL